MVIPSMLNEYFVHENLVNSMKYELFSKKILFKKPKTLYLRLK